MENLTKSLKHMSFLLHILQSFENVLNEHKITIKNVYSDIFFQCGLGRDALIFKLIRAFMLSIIFLFSRE